MIEPTILKVAVNVPLSRLFDYLAPAGVAHAKPGCRVLVPFGRRKQVGLIMECVQASDLPANKLKRCEAVLDDEPLLAPADLQLIRFTSTYYHHPIGEVAAAAMPSLLRAGKPLWPIQKFVAVSDAGAAAGRRCAPAWRSRCHGFRRPPARQKGLSRPSHPGAHVPG